MAKQKQEKRVNKPKQKTEFGFFSTHDRWYGLIIFVFGFAIYFNSVFNDYNLDDELVTQNHRLTSKGISAISEIFKSPYYQDESGYKYEYRPVVLAVFAIEHSLFGDNVRISHFINVLLYGLLCMLLFYVLKKLLKRFNPLFPFLIALIFTAHPIHTEVVASIKNRDEILALGFGLLSLFYATAFAESKKGLPLLLVLIFFLTGILSKSTTLVFAGLIPLSLIMLTDTTFRPLIFVTIALAVPATIFSRLYSVSHQFVFAAALFSSVIFLYCLKNYDLSFEKVKLLVIAKYKQLVAVPEQYTETSPALHFHFLKDRAGILLMILILSASALSFLGLYIGEAWSIIPFGLLILAYQLARKEGKAIIITPISLITLFALIKIQTHTNLIQTGLILFLVGHILAGNKTLKAIAIFNYLLYIVVAVVFIHSWFFLIVLLFAGLISKKLMPVTILTGMFSLALLSTQVFKTYTGNKALSLALLSLPIIWMSFYLLWKGKQQFFLKVSSLSIPLFMLLYFAFAPPPENVKAAIGLEKAYHKATTMKATEATPVQAVRPLKYIEYPIERNDPVSVKLGTAMVILGKYLKLIFLPYPLSFYYGYAYIVPTQFMEVMPVLIFIIHLLMLGIALYFIRKDSLLSFSILFYLTAIAVFSNLFIPIPGMMGDRFLLIPSIGFCFFLTVCLGKIFKQDFTASKLRLGALSQPFKIILSLILLLYTVVTIARNTDWKDRITLFRNDIKVVENSAQAQNLLGLHLYLASTKETDKQKEKLMQEEAILHLRKALEIYPEFLNASFDLGRIYEIRQEVDSAYAQYERTLLIDSTFTVPCFSMALIQQNKGNLEKAIPLYEKFLTKHPDQMEVYANLSYAYFVRGKYDSSIAVNKRSLNFIPNSYEANVNIGKTYLKMNMNDSALHYLQEANRLKPGDPMVQDVMQQLRK